MRGSKNVGELIRFRQNGGTFRVAPFVFAPFVFGVRQHLSCSWRELEHCGWILHNRIVIDLGDLLEDIAIGPGGGRRFEAVIRILFGIVGALLAFAGAFHILSYEAGIAFRAAAIVFFIFFGCFWAFNVALYRKWRWPGRFLVISFIGIFAVRILLGA
jgi:hypothetical protein